MDETRLAAIRATADQATEWRRNGDVDLEEIHRRYVASAETVPELLDLVDRLEAENQQLRDELAQRRQLLTEWMAWWEADDEAPVKLPNALHVRTALTLATPDLAAVSDGN